MAESADPHETRPAARADVLTTLRRHDISGVVAAALWSAAQDLTRRTRRRGIEHAVTLDRESAQPVGPVLTGTPTSTDLSRHLAVMQPDRSYVVLHTHPRSTSFSALDVLMLTSQPAITAMAVVGIDGVWYVLSRDATGGAQNPRDPFDAYLRAYQAVEQTIAFDERPDVALRSIAGPNALRYDKIMGP